jgi:putative phosphoesterase
LKIALFSDIHGNLPAFEAVISALQRQKIDQLVCLGDICLLGPQPVEALHRLKELGCPVVMGNTDHWSLDPSNFERHDEVNPIFFDLERWAGMRLSAADREFIQTFKPTLEIALPAKEVLLCCHGSPHNFIDQISTNTPQEKLIEMLAGVNALVVACGHTHAPLLRRVGRSLVVNPGSVGRPVQLDLATEKVQYGLWAEYAILEVETGQVAVTFHRVTYDINKLFHAARVNEMPHLEHWLGMWKAD